MLDLIFQGDWRNMVGADQTRRISACGARSVAVLLALKDMAYHPILLARACSRDIDPESLNTIGYAAVALHRGKEED